MSHADDFLDFSRAEDRRARKHHECDACDLGISSGDTYKRWFIVHDDEPDVIRQCWRCWLVWSAINERSNDPIDITLGCDESWEDALGPMPPHVQALAFALPSEVQPGWQP
jgi:hypothetical protein